MVEGLRGYSAAVEDFQQMKCAKRNADASNTSTYACSFCYIVYRCSPSLKTEARTSIKYPD